MMPFKVELLVSTVIQLILSAALRVGFHACSVQRGGVGLVAGGDE